MSSSKIDMLYAQNESTVSKVYDKELGAEFSSNIASLSGKMSTKKITSVGIYEKLAYVENSLKRNNLVGTLFENKPFIEGKYSLNSLFSTLRNHPVTWSFSYHDTARRALFHFLFYGSGYNVVGHSDGGHTFYPYTKTMSLPIIFIQDILLQLEEGHSKLSNESGYNYNEYIKSARIKQRWEIVEYLRQLYAFSCGSASPRHFLVRIDSRETVTREQYLQSDFIIDGYEYERENGNNGSQITCVLPDDVDYVVYVFGSPIYVEQVVTDERVHIINGKGYLYLSDNELYSLMNNKAHNKQRDIVEQIANHLKSAGMEYQARSFSYEYWDLMVSNHCNDLNEDDFIKLIRSYTTPIPPL